MEKLHMVEEDLCLYRFSCKGRRKTIAVGVNRGEAALANGERRVAEYTVSEPFLTPFCFLP